ncbi:GNAT family N-acetyltransferase [Pseudohongiella acticola]|jgi:GNAT superfamily N-acetyltransferase|uniref:GNAT family N-acetyltransferase n=1 Tax=Pseudohongiella acticola TaxID=1524254 RepID=UPI0030EC8750
MEIEYLADRPDAIDLVARWYVEEWGGSNSRLTLESVSRSLTSSMNRDSLPLMLLAVEQKRVVGAVELKIREMSIYPDKEHWLGGLYVDPACRGSGIGRQLIKRAIALASTLGVSMLYLQTERLDGGVYASLGWKPYEQVSNKGIDVLIMERDV